MKILRNAVGSPSPHLRRPDPPKARLHYREGIALLSRVSDPLGRASRAPSPGSPPKSPPGSPLLAKPASSRTQWQRTAAFQARDRIPVKKYNRLVMEDVRACRRLRDLIWRCEILQPVSRYELAVDGIVITGEYAVLRSSRRRNHAFVPYLRYNLDTHLERLLGPDCGQSCGAVDRLRPGRR